MIHFLPVGYPTSASYLTLPLRGARLSRQMYAGTGISTDSARRKKSKTWARWTAKQCKKLFQAKPMPDLQSPTWQGASAEPYAGISSAHIATPFVVLLKEE
jgi:hypothetical protein